MTTMHSTAPHQHWPCGHGVCAVVQFDILRRGGAAEVLEETARHCGSRAIGRERVRGARLDDPGAPMSEHHRPQGASPSSRTPRSRWGRPSSLKVLN